MSVGYQNGGSGQQQGEADWDALRDDVGEIAGVAMERGRHFLDSAREQATTYVDRRKDDVAQSVTEFATSLRESTRSFEDRPNIQAFVDGAAEGLDQLADSIRARSFAEIFNDVEDVVRRRPTVVAAVTLTAGFLVARFIKASAEGLRHQPGAQQRRQGGSSQRPSAQHGSGSRAGSRA
jgi:ElaB/YqjD/DUF883 family membrane-anchored ribosome-binding protein